jgi:hypothetical protein
LSGKLNDGRALYVVDVLWTHAADAGDLDMGKLAQLHLASQDCGGEFGTFPFRTPLQHRPQARYFWRDA